MSSQPVTPSKNHPELRSLYQVSQLSPTLPPKDYFHRTMSILTQFFPVGYAALILRDEKRGDLEVEALYGTAMADHPLQGSGGRGIVGEVIESRSPRVIQGDLHGREWENAAPVRARPPLLCIPLLEGHGALGAFLINPLMGNREDFEEDLQFLTVLSALLSSAIKYHRSKSQDDPPESKRSAPSAPLLEEILKERLTEFLKKVDPYVESKSRSGLLRDVVSLVEKIMIKLAMERVNHVQTSAALLLGINRNTLRAKLKEFKIKPRKTGGPP
ncbi:MAG: GAF domain-containing protein [Desulfobacterota bacterium]|nr:GAF domain-containing protein [Thermodesulfobacteriota bacterium]